MAIREIEESELENLGRVAQFFDTALKDPRTRKQVQQVVKTLHPNAVIPEIDAAKPIEDKIDKLYEMFEEDRAARQEKELNAEFAKRWQDGQNYVRQQGYTAEGLADIEKFMQDNAIADHRIAVPAYAAMNPSQHLVAPGVNGMRRWDLGNPDTFQGDSIAPLQEKLQKGEIKGRQFVRAAAAQALRDIA